MEAVAAIRSPADGVLMPGCAEIKGRIVARRRITSRNGRLWLTIVRLPAPDEFTSPATVELQSVEGLGDVGDIVRCRVRIGGYARSFDATDPETGAKVRQQAANNTLEVVL